MQVRMRGRRESRGWTIQAQKQTLRKEKLEICGGGWEVWFNGGRKGMVLDHG